MTLIGKRDQSITAFGATVLSRFRASDRRVVMGLTSASAAGSGPASMHSYAEMWQHRLSDTGCPSHEGLRPHPLNLIEFILAKGMSRVKETPALLLPTIRRALEQVRAQAPLVQCITNSVVVNFTANTLLALGAAPAMVDLPGESCAFAPIAFGLLINVGTPTAEQRAAALEAASAAHSAGIPWVLDPVAVGALPVRTELAHRLLEYQPTIVRGNPSEILALAGSGTGGRGVDSADDVDAALDAASGLARSTGAVVAVSGAIDMITDGARTVRVANGHELLTKVTGGGCALGAVLAAFAGTVDDPFEAAVAGTATWTVAAEEAARRADGPGSFAVALLDVVHALDAGELERRVVLS